MYGDAAHGNKRFYNWLTFKTDNNRIAKRNYY